MHHSGDTPTAPRLSVDGEALWGDLSEEELSEAGRPSNPGNSAMMRCDFHSRHLEENLQMVLKCW